MADLLPIDYPSEEELNPLAFVIGGVVLRWGMAENAINSLVIAVFKYAGGRHIEDEMPRAFKRKVTFLRRCFRSIAILAPYKETALIALENAVQLSLRRNAIIHSYLSMYDPNTSKFKFVGLDSKGEESVVSETFLTVLEVYALSQECRDLANTCADLWLEIFPLGKK